MHGSVFKLYNRMKKISTIIEDMTIEVRKSFKKQCVTSNILDYQHIVVQDNLFGDPRGRLCAFDKTSDGNPHGYVVIDGKPSIASGGGYDAEEFDFLYRFNVIRTRGLPILEKDLNNKSVVDNIISMISTYVADKVDSYAFRCIADAKKNLTKVGAEHDFLPEIYVTKDWELVKNDVGQENLLYGFGGPKEIGSFNVLNDLKIDYDVKDTEDGVEYTLYPIMIAGITFRNFNKIKYM